MVVIHRHLAGQIDGGAEFAVQVQIGGRAMNGFGGFAAGLQGLEIERGLDFDKMPQLSAGSGWPCSSSCQENVAGFPDSTSFKV